MNKSFKERKIEFTNRVFEVMKNGGTYTKEQLVEITKLTEREVRSQIHDISIYYAVISNSSTKGYRLANVNFDNKEDISKEIDLLNYCINEDKKRAREIIKRISRKIAVMKILKKKLESDF